ncbi:hypothetical protein V8E36_002120 [Tilletia maclaganii]
MRDLEPRYPLSTTEIGPANHRILSPRRGLDQQTTTPLPKPGFGSRTHDSSPHGGDWVSEHEALPRLPTWGPIRGAAPLGPGGGISGGRMRKICQPRDPHRMSDDPNSSRTPAGLFTSPFPFRFTSRSLRGQENGAASRRPQFTRYPRGYLWLAHWEGSSQPIRRREAKLRSYLFLSSAGGEGCDHTDLCAHSQIDALSPYWSAWRDTLSL